jgi:hypothetical protein
VTIENSHLVYLLVFYRVKFVLLRQVLTLSLSLGPNATVQTLYEIPIIFERIVFQSSAWDWGTEIDKLCDARERP